MKNALLLILILSLSIAVLCASTLQVRAHEGDAEDGGDVDGDEDDNFDVVTCGSVVKLMHVASHVRLHSHEIPYGSGSGQQSVTGFREADDPNSLWLVKKAHGKPCERGTPIRGNQLIRLEHVATRKNLHSHKYPSPISHQQEIAAFGEAGEGDDLDNWRVIVGERSSKSWMREDPVRFYHPATKVYLHCHAHEYQNPIPGQREVTGFPQGDDSNNYWAVQEGVFFPTDVEAERERLKKAKDEL